VTAGSADPGLVVAVDIGTTGVKAAAAGEGQ
jgi:sugar (pentulose or hexulose) kinase